MKTQIISIAAHQSKMRLDKYLVAHIRNCTREHIQSLIKNGFVKVNDTVVKKTSFGIPVHGSISVMLPYREELEIVPQPEIPVDVLYEDTDMVVINKPAGLVVHPAPGNWEGTLVNALFGRQVHEEHFKEKTFRLGLVHRLDKDTSGVMVIAKNEASKAKLSEQFKNRSVKKSYLALVHGILQPATGRIEGPLGRDPRNRKKMALVSHGKDATTEYQVLEYRDNHYTLVEAMPKTGRTHQIRVHFASIGFPIVGDVTYGRKNNALGLTRQALHAWKLEITDMAGKQQCYVAEPPEEIFGEMADQLVRIKLKL